jgi:hypothetical protein
MDIAHDESNQTLDPFDVGSRFFATGAGGWQVAFKAMDPEVSPTGGEICFSYLENSFEGHKSILRVAS